MSEAMKLLETVMKEIHTASGLLEEGDSETANSHLAKAAATLQAVMNELSFLLKAVDGVFLGKMIQADKAGTADGNTTDKE